MESFGRAGWNHSAARCADVCVGTIAGEIQGRRPMQFDLMSKMRRRVTGRCIRRARRGLCSYRNGRTSGASSGCAPPAQSGRRSLPTWFLSPTGDNSSSRFHLMVAPLKVGIAGSALWVPRSSLVKPEPQSVRALRTRRSRRRGDGARRRKSASRSEENRLGEKSAGARPRARSIARGTDGRLGR